VPISKTPSGLIRLDFWRTMSRPDGIYASGPSPTSGRTRSTWKCTRYLD
jgi:hypothetical protein